ncbi:hypothetical protein HPP92_013599 [Vanilla planifolia]|uniref:Uncharacterized protein n=1 Tax=Vanilla planifolia TaxID=51239 RepID=A0A835QU69_VANPL|nr:hypothetical protein HPP92_014037 [Vanilla planifolia]KAG0478880.1 hypothetical protein HPP92_013599 [Vanilla planifolia]
MRTGKSYLLERKIWKVSWICLQENLYNVAINLVHSQQADASATAEVLRKYGDHLYGKQDYNEAISKQLQERGLASKDHTTLLLNCYTKLKDVEKLNKFIKGEESVGEQRFDVETAIRVCRSAGYHEHAM